jgi:hypothetical protein
MTLNNVNNLNIIIPQEPNNNYYRASMNNVNNNLYYRARQLFNDDLFNKNVENIYSDLVDNNWSREDIYHFFLDFYDVIDQFIMTNNNSGQEWIPISRWDISPETQLREIDDFIINRLTRNIVDPNR